MIGSGTKWLAANMSSKIDGCFELTECPLNLDFPGSRGANINHRAGSDNFPGLAAEARAICQPPQQNVCIKQQIQGRSPRKAAAIDSGNSSKSRLILTFPFQIPGFVSEARSPPDRRSAHDGLAGARDDDLLTGLGTFDQAG